MITRGKSFLVFGPNTLRFQELDSKDVSYLVFEFDSSMQSIGFNSAVIYFRKHPTQYYILNPGFEPVSQGSINLDKALDEFGLKASFFGHSITGSENLTPLYLISQDGNTIYTYTFMLSHIGELLFLNTGKNSVSNKGVSIHNISELIRIAVTNNQPYRYKLNNYNALYYKVDPDIECEYKLTLPETTDIWKLHKHFIQSLQEGSVPGYTLNALHGIRRWTFENHLFEVTEPEKERGYISFISNPDGTYIIKRKIYSIDQLKRIELRSKNIEIKGSLERYIKEKYPNVKIRKFPMFLRLFYSFVMDSLDTGNNYAVIIDRNYIEGIDCEKLVQCEIEYYNTLKLTPPESFDKELRAVTDIFKQHLVQLNIGVRDDFYSKLSYLKDCTK